MEGDVSLQLPPGSAGSGAEPARRRRRRSASSPTRCCRACAQRPRSIPCRFFYDARGSELFEEITKLDEYYPTRVETALLEAHGEEIAALAGDGRILVEFGSGSSRKTSLLLGALSQVPAYIPIDIAAESLEEAAAWLSGRHAGPHHPAAHRRLHRDARAAPDGAAEARLGFFSGSTIGNLTHGEARAFLGNAARLLGPGSAFLLGVDLKKSELDPGPRL